MYVAYAAPRLDGVASAAILLRHARLRDKDIKIHFGVDEAQRNAILFVLDIPPPNAEFIQKLAKNNKIAYWCHHQKTKYDELIKQHSAIADINIECSAEMTMKRFMPNDSVSKEISRIAKDREEWINRDETAKKLSELLAYGHDKKELAQMMSKGVFWTPHLEAEHAHYLLKKKEAITEMENTKTTKTYVGQQAAYYICKNIIPTDEAGEHALKHSETDFVILMYKDGSIIFRKREGNKTSMAQIAHQFEGGGNTHAAGAKLNKKPTQETKDSIIKEIDDKLKKYFFR